MEPITTVWQAIAALPDRLRPLLELYWQAEQSPPGTLTGRSLNDRDPAVIDRLLPIFAWVYHHYFPVTVDGWEHVPDGQVLLIGAHNGGLAVPDTVMLTYAWFARYGTQRSVYALMEPRMWTAMPGLARLATQVGTLRAEPRMAIAALDSGASLLIYPGGAKDVFRPFTQRHKIRLNNQHGFIKLALEYRLPIVPIVSNGAHETLIVLAEIHDQLEALAHGKFPWPLGFDPGIFPIYLGLPWGIAIGPLPNIPFPRPIHLQICPAITFERTGASAAQDQVYVHQCYLQVEQVMQQALDRLVAESAPSPQRVE